MKTRLKLRLLCLPAIAAVRQAAWECLAWQMSWQSRCCSASSWCLAGGAQQAQAQACDTGLWLGRLLPEQM